MHPFHHAFHFHRPSRVFWFIIGAGAATWWHHSSAMREHRAQYFPCLMQQRRVEGQDRERSGNTSGPYDATGPQDGGRSVWNSSWGPTHDGTVGWNQREWETDKERLRNLQKRAGEAAVDLSDSTLDSIVSAAESLKAKLAAHRTQREQLLKQEGLDAEKKDPHLGA
ncbi:hypothetical protein BDN67DRAFT_977654 [Paxillus ammoniavirescens]|nr:hypothetical protein BDN67DRAFT_977654 [Paxillus ammoniavirescens]